MKPRIAITMGDPAGIGPEIISKALQDSRVLSWCNPIVVADPAAFAFHRQPLPKVEFLAVPGLNKQIALGKPSASGGHAALECLEKAIALIENRNVSALVTAPVSKQALQLAGAKIPGHTEWLAQKSGAKKIAMLMVAGSLRTILLTRHLPISKVSSALSQELIMESAQLGYSFVKKTLRIKKPRLILCGLNPHAGDNGILGSEEQTVMKPAVLRLKKEGIALKGPDAADSAFRDMKNGLYDLALAAYHDQGMIALKVHAEDQLVNATLGLPYIRTSPGHGTAYDIAGKNKAHAESMIEAIRLAALWQQ